MKRINKLIKSVLSIAMALVFILIAGCKVDDPNNKATIVPKPPVQKEIILKQTSLDMIVGTEKLLEIEKYDRESENPITWSSNDETVATVDSEGWVEAIKEGEAIITVSQGEITAQCEIEVSFGEDLAELVLPVGESFNIQQGKEFDMSPAIEFMGKTYYDGEFTYTVSDEDNFSIEDGKLIGTETGKSTEILIEGAWRGKTSADMITLKKSVTVNVIDSVNLLIEECAGDILSVYTAEYFNGKTYANKSTFTPVVYVNGELKANAEVSVSISGSSAEYDQTNGMVVGKQAGISTVTVSYTHEGSVLVETFYVEVIRPVAHFAQKVNYFSAHSGTYRDASDNFKEKTLFDILYPGQTGINLISAKTGDTELTVENNKVLGIQPAKAGTREVTIEVGSQTSSYTVDLIVYGQYVYEAKDLDVFVRTNKVLAYDGYVELGRDIDASSYTAGVHFPDIDSGSAKYPTTSSGQTFGADKSYYSGVFDGKGYTIDGLTVGYNPDHVSYGSTGNIVASNERTAFGIFTALEGATIKNIAFTNTNLLGRCMFGFYAKDTNFENVRIDVDSLVKQDTYQGNVFTYYAIVGGSLNNIYVTVAETYDISTARLIFGSIAPVAVSTSVKKPTYSNVVVVSKLPIGYSARFGAATMIAYATNDTAEYKEAINKHLWARYGTGSVCSTMKKEYEKQDNYDANITDYRVLELAKNRNQVLEGTYRFNTVADLVQDTNMAEILAQFPQEYWTVSNGQLVWGAN